MAKELSHQTLKEFRNDRGMTQRQLADKLHLPTNYISLYETGRQDVPELTKETFRKLFPKYNVIEMRAGVIEQQEPILEQEKPEALKPEAVIEQTLLKKEELKNLIHELRPEKPLTKTIHILRKDGEAYAYLSYAQALDELSSIILADPETYGWTITEAELR